MTETPSSPNPPPGPSRGVRTSRWPVMRRRAVWTIFSIAGVLLVLRIALIFIFPAVLEHVLAFYKLTARYQEIKLDVFGGDAEIWGLKIRPIQGGPNVMDIAYCHGNISIINLFRGRLYVRRAVADGADLFVRRQANGDCPLLDALFSSSRRQVLAQPQVSRSATTISLAAPLHMTAFRLEHLRLHLIDRSVKPVVSLAITMDVRVSHLGRRHGATRFNLTLWSSSVVDVLHIHGSLTTGRRKLLAQCHILMRGLRLQPVRGYLAALDFKPSKAGISFQATSTLALSVIKTKASTPAIAAVFALQHLQLNSGGRPAFGIERLLAHGQLGPHLADIRSLAISGLTIHAGRGKNGLFHFAGLELLRRIVAAGSKLVRPAATVRQPGRDAATPSGSHPQASQANGRYQYAVDQLTIHNLKLVFDDAHTIPSAHLLMTFKSLKAVSTGGLPGTAGQRLTIAGDGALPGIAAAVNISGEMLPFARTRQLKLHLAATGITASALAPYLSAVGLKSELRSASFNADFSAASTTSPDGTTAATLHLDHLLYRDGRTTLCDFKHVDVDQVRVNPSTGRLEIGSCNIVGPAFDFSRQTSGAYTVLGMQILQPRPGVAALPTTPAPPAGTTVLRSQPGGGGMSHAPRVQIDHFHWSGIRIGFDDQHAHPATRIDINHAGLILHHFILDLAAKSAIHRTGAFKAWLAAPGLIHLGAVGTLGPGQKSLTTSMRVTGTGINLRPLTPYLGPLGILPLLTNGSFTGQVGAGVALRGGKLVGSVRLSELKLRQASHSLAGVNALEISGIAAARHDLAVQRVLIVKPFLQVTRLAGGNLSVCGLELLPPPAGAASTAIAHAHVPPMATTPMRVAVSNIAVSGAILRWIDLDASHPVDVRLHMAAAISNAIVGHQHPPMGKLQANMSAKGVADAIRIGGSFALPVHALRANLQLQATGLHGQIINAYLPSGTAFVPHGQSIAAALNLRLQRGAGGSISGVAGIQNLKISAAAGAAQPHDLLVAPNLTIDFNRINLPRHVVAIHAIQAHIKSLHVARGQHFWSICGWHIGNKVNPKPPGHLVATASPHIFSILPAQLPLITLSQLQWRIDNLALAGLLPDRRPLHLTSIDLHNTTPIRCLGPAPAQAPAVALLLTGSAPGIARHMALVFHLRPFANHPRATAHVAITDIRGAGLMEMAPALRRRFALQGLKTGAFTADASLALQLDRRSPLDFNFAEPFSASAALSNIAFRDKPNGPIAVGVGQIAADKIIVQPARSSVAVAVLNIRKPRLRLTHDAAGWTVAGLRLRRHMAPPLQTLTHRVAAPPALQRTQIHPLSVLIKRTVISGIDARYIDHTCTPPVEIPLTGLEAQIFNLGTTPFTRHIPVRFNVIAYAGAVKQATLPIKALTTAPKSPPRQPAAPPPTTKAEPLFAQFSSNGQLYLYPRIRGWARAALNGLYLAELAPLAKKYGVTITAGTFDDSGDLRIHNSEHMNVHTKLVFSNLDLSEPPHGTLARLLHLPTPLNVALAALEAPDGSITLPLSVPISTGRISQSAVTGQILADLVQVVAVGIASSPLKLAGGLASLFGSGKLRVVKEPPIKLHFTPSSATLTSRDWLAIDALARRLRHHDSLQVVVRQQISTADIAVAARRANPTKSECLQLIGALETRTARLLAKRQEEVGRLRGELAIRLSDTAIGAAIAHLTRVDAKLARARMAIHYLADMLAPGADRNVARRTRGVMMIVARRRLSEIKTALLAGGFAHPHRRVHIVFPQYLPAKSDQGGPAVITLVRAK